MSLTPTNEDSGAYSEETQLTSKNLCWGFISVKENLFQGKNPFLLQIELHIACAGSFRLLQTRKHKTV